MPVILALETSTPHASLAVLCDGCVIFEGGVESDRSHNALLFGPLADAVRELGGRRLDAVVIGTGPGSYSGTRVGIAAGQGLAMVHGCPAVGLSSLLATEVAAGIAIGDARRGSAWWAEIGRGLPEPELVPAAELAAKVGSAGTLFSFEETAGLGLPESIQVARLRPQAVRLAEAWLGLAGDLREHLCKLPPQPAYLRPPHVTESKKGHPLLRERS